MPYKKRTYKRKAYNKKKAFRGKRTGMLPRQLQPKIFRFKRDIEQTLTLSGSTAPEGWAMDGNNRTYTNLAWALGSLGENTDFTSLFRQYRLKGARVKLFFSNTISGTEQDSSHSNSQLLVRMSKNNRGSLEVLDDAYWSSVQAKKYKLAINGGRPLDIYMPLTQLNETASSTGTAYTMAKPKFVSTQTTNVPHHGLNLSIERVDGQGFTSGFTNNQYVKMITTIYFQTRGVE